MPISQWQWYYAGLCVCMTIWIISVGRVHSRPFQGGGEIDTSHPSPTISVFHLPDNLEQKQFYSCTVLHTLKYFHGVISLNLHGHQYVLVTQCHAWTSVDEYGCAQGHANVTATRKEISGYKSPTSVVRSDFNNSSEFNRTDRKNKSRLAISEEFYWLPPHLFSTSLQCVHVVESSYWPLSCLIFNFFFM